MAQCSPPKYAPVYCYRSSQFIKPEKLTAKFAVQVCGREKSFAVTEVQKITANVPQTCGYAVADHLLLFFGICGCAIEWKFAVPSTDYLLVKYCQEFVLQQSFYIIRIEA